jgi:hypothetical protein
VPTANTTSVTASDGCGGTVTVTHVGDVISNQTCTNRYTITRTYRATDVCGNSAICTQTITVNDVTPPVFSNCPASYTVACANTFSYGATPTVSDGCTGTVSAITFTDVNTTLSNGNIQHCRTWRATDACGNTGTCTQCITEVECGNMYATGITCSDYQAGTFPEIGEICYKEKKTGNMAQLRNRYCLC